MRVESHRQLNSRLLAARRVYKGREYALRDVRLSDRTPLEAGGKRGSIPLHPTNQPFNVKRNMKKEDKTRQPRRQAENRGQKEEMFTKEQVMSLAQLITAGVMGIGGQECVDQAQELPMELQNILISSILASRQCMKDMVPSMLSSILAKAAAVKRNNNV